MLGTLPWLFEILLVMLFFSIAYQDFKDRAVYWWLYLLTFLVLMVQSFSEDTFYLIDLLTNLSFLSIQYVAVILYFSIKNRKLTWLLKDQFGLGDVLLILTLACFLETSVFLFIYLSSLVTSIIWVAYKYVREKEFPTVPLAGIMSLASVMIITCGHFDFIKLY